MQVLANPIRINGQRLPNRPAPLLGADTDVILTDLGIGADELAALKLAGIV
jgi:crotonobetainyl-CoA:carnitine CoA-transferase CaiB-like acyl-CoA transferase